MDIAIVQNVIHVRNLRNLHFRQWKVYNICKNSYNKFINNGFRKKYCFSKAECLHIAHKISDFLPRAVSKRRKPISPSLQF